MKIKVHIPRLPTIPYSVPKAEADTRLAISIPLFHSDFQWIQGGIEKDRFQQVHCRGAIWTALSLLYNTDLGAKGVCVFFHIEETVWDIALPIFQEFGVDEKWMRKVSIPVSKCTSDVENVHYGKKFMCVIDAEMQADVLMVVDSDAFVCAAGRPLEWYQVLSSSMFLKHPSTFEFRPTLVDYEHWVKRCTNAVGLPFDPDVAFSEQEKAVYDRIGLPYPFTREKNIETLNVAMRPVCSNVYITIPRRYKISDFIASNFNQCYEDEYLLAIFATVYGLMLSFRASLNLEIFTQTDAYLAFTHQRNTLDGYIHHLIFGSYECDAFFSRFYKDLTRNIPIELPNLAEWQKIYGSTLTDL